MVLQLSDTLIRKGDVREFQFPLGFSSIVWDGKERELEAVGPVRMKVENAGNSTYLFHTEFEAKLHLPCDRCLTDVACPILLEDDRERKLSAEETEKDPDEEETCIHGYELDVDEFIRSELFLRIPMKVLCREDCKGLCPKCGANRNLGSCGCEDGPLDPRMAVIQDIFRKANHG